MGRDASLPHRLQGFEEYLLLNSLAIVFIHLVLLNLIIVDFRQWRFLVELAIRVFCNISLRVSFPHNIHNIHNSDEITIVSPESITAGIDFVNLFLRRSRPIWAPLWVFLRCWWGCGAAIIEDGCWATCWEGAVGRLKQVGLLIGR